MFKGFDISGIQSSVKTGDFYFLLALGPAGLPFCIAGGKTAVASN
jgi:hypothetical protein